MTVAELKTLLAQIEDDSIEALVRCTWDDDLPNGNCFQIVGVTEDYAHDEAGTHFAALDCDQEFEAG